MITREHIGITRIRHQTVTRERTAAHIGSGSHGVYATPAMLAFVESACRELLDELLDEAHTSVGTAAKLRHLAPTPEGATVEVEVEIISVDGTQVGFRAAVRDNVELVGEFEHTRAVIEIERFQKRVSAKSRQ